MLLKSPLVCGLFVAGIIAEPSLHFRPLSAEGTSLEFRNGDKLPYLKLPYATYRAASYDDTLDVYRFRNIRFAASAGGINRWREPQPPEHTDEIERENFPKISCPQVHLGVYKDSPMTEDDKPPSIEREDCLLLDMQIPGKVARDPDKYSVPIIVFFFGGAFVFGAKDSIPGLMYDGGRLINRSGGDLIWISPNYRLGAMGWLAGTTVEQEATPNAGLHDQHFALKWVQDHLPSIGGNKSMVTAVGQSAGASSLLHHLVLEGGTLNPLFNQVVLLSPAFMPLYDRKGDLEATFQGFSAEVSKNNTCKAASIDCLRKADEAVIIAANKKIIGERQKGSFIFGPTADGQLIRQMPALEFATGSYWEGIDSIVLSHTSLEGWMFANKEIDSDARFRGFLDGLFPPYTSALVDQMIDFYPVLDYEGPDESNPQKARLATFIRDAVITCNIRWVSKAYSYLGDPKPPGSYNMIYDTVPLLHGADIIPHFVDEKDLLQIFNVTLVSKFMNTYRDYFISFYKTGDPNTWHHADADPSAVWEKVHGAIRTDFPYMWKALRARGGSLPDWQFINSVDIDIPKKTCDFWFNIQAAMTSLGGYAPPGSDIPSPYDPDNDSPSKNYNSADFKEKFVVQEL